MVKQLCILTCCCWIVWLLKSVIFVAAAVADANKMLICGEEKCAVVVWYQLFGLSGGSRGLHAFVWKVLCHLIGFEDVNYHDSV